MLKSCYIRAKNNIFIFCVLCTDIDEAQKFGKIQNSYFIIWDLSSCLKIVQVLHTQCSLIKNPEFLEIFLPKNNTLIT
jgi:hypothetical protein